jgi:transposase
VAERERKVQLSDREVVRLRVLDEVRHGKRTQAGAAQLLDLSDRQVRTLLHRLKRRGPAGLIHGNRGRPSKRRIPGPLRERIIEHYRGRYHGWNLAHFGEMLQEREGMTPPSGESIRQMLKMAGLWEERRKAPRHRLRRPRREQEGELLQVDASLHAWLGPDHPRFALVGAVDDATGEVVDAQFFPAESTEAYLSLLKGILRKRGVPKAIYSDRHGTFVVNNSQQAALLRAQGLTLETQISRALKELGIEWIAAYSPQAKGRIERLWGVFQDRLLKELRLEGIRTLKAANAYLQRRFLPRYNRQFRLPAARKDRAYRAAPLHRILEGILCWKEPRVLARDHTFSWEGKLWQVQRCPSIPALTGRRIEVRRSLRGTMQAWAGQARLKLSAATPFRPARELRAAEPSYSKRGKVHRPTLSARLNRT